MTPRPRTSGFTMLELSLALLVTLLVGAAIASMLAMVGRSTSVDGDRRSITVRAQAAQVRLNAYVPGSLCALQYDPGRALALWLQDDKPANNVHLSELRVIEFDSAAGLLVIERVHFPDAWSQSLKDDADIALPLGADYLATMADLRSQGFTAFETVLDGATSFDAAFDAKAVQDAQRATITLGVGAPGGTTGETVLFAFGLPGHRKPTS